MQNANNIQMDPASKYLSVLQEYTGTVERLFPTLTKDTLSSISISLADALFIGYFLDSYPRRVTVLEEGVSSGASTFFFASHPKVSKVVTTDSNSPITKDTALSSGGPEGNAAVESSESPGRQEVARGVFGEYAIQRQKIELHDLTESPVDAMETMEKLKSLAPLKGVPLSDTGLIVLLRDPQGRTEVSDALVTVFDQHPQAIVLLSNCRGSRGPFVQAGVADFIEKMRDDYLFRLVGDIGLGLSSSVLGVVYPNETASETDDILGEVSGHFGKRLDPLRLLQREEEPTPKADQAAVQSSKQVKELRQQIHELTEQNEQLTKHYSSRRYKLADAVMNRVLRVKSLRRLLR